MSRCDMQHVLLGVSLAYTVVRQQGLITKVTV